VPEPLRKPPFRVARMTYRWRRGAVRGLGQPVRWLPEGSSAKVAARTRILRHQHSLPTELTVNRGDVVVQVGTPNPRTLLRYRRALGAEGRLVIVEAMPDNQERLARTISDHGLDNVTLVRAAACDENRQGELAISPFWGDHRIPLESVEMDNDRRPENARMELIPVSFVRLDDVLPDLGVPSIDYLSVTVNGAEAEVLKGARQLLAASPRHGRVYAKGHALDEQRRPIHLQCEEILRSLGYSTVITHGEPSSTLDADWLWRAGDVYAWKA
jgi:FkbM family methyltransferase